MKFTQTITIDEFILKGLESTETNDSIVLHFHGMSGDIIFNDFYPFMHEIFPKNGFDFVACGQRGSCLVQHIKKTTGEYVLQGNAYEIFEESIFDIEGWVKYAVEKGYKNIYLQGHSLAPSKLAYSYANSQYIRDNISGMIFMSPSGMKGLMMRDQIQDEYKRFSQLSKEMINKGRGNDLIGQSFDEGLVFTPNSFINILGKKSNCHIFNYHDEVSNWTIINDVKIPVLAISSIDDMAICSICETKKGLDMLTKQLKNSPTVKTICYESAGHQYEGYEEKLVNDIIKFLKQITYTNLHQH